jgi:hypothetical protein
MEESRRDWQALLAEVEATVKGWRKAHPRATFTEIETALDAEMARVRARMLEELALASDQTDWRGQEGEERPRCPVCGEALQANGFRERRLVTDHEQPVTLRRQHGRCPACEASVFPPG